ncbi:unnamed protein product [Paramecium sonneborni]|uniref:Uncharacterized protein n=1 Tax=Paramecium sonneborni TaxID=65129 RepID=A0A8S1MMP1_9CILI|nr:unnamed protein product [Paramecium sonneborni]
MLNQLDRTITQIYGLSIVLGIGIYVSKENMESIYPLYFILIQMMKYLLKAYLIEMRKDLLMICLKLKKYIRFKWFQKWRYFENKEEQKRRMKNKFNSKRKSILVVSRGMQQGRKEIELSIIEDKNKMQMRQDEIEKEINSIMQKQQISSISRDLEMTISSSKGQKVDMKLFSKVFPEKSE